VTITQAEFSRENSIFNVTLHRKTNSIDPQFAGLSFPPSCRTNCKFIVIGAPANILFTCSSICRFRKARRVTVSSKVRRQELKFRSFLKLRFLLGFEDVNCSCQSEKSPSSAGGLGSVFSAISSLQTRWS